MADLNVVGGDVALDLVDTVEPRVPGEAGREHLGSPAALLAWARRVGVLDPAEADRVAAAWRAGRDAEPFAATLRIREALYAALLALHGTDVLDSASALEELQRAWAAAAQRSALRLAPPGEDRLVVGGDPRWAVPDRLAHAAVELLRTVDPVRLKACPLEEGGCGWFFLDRSRNGSRRWCSMGDCGSRTKASRLTARRRAARSAAR